MRSSVVHKEEAYDFVPASVITLRSTLHVRQTSTLQGISPSGTATVGSSGTRTSVLLDTTEPCLDTGICSGDILILTGMGVGLIVFLLLTIIITTSLLCLLQRYSRSRSFFVHIMSGVHAD